MSDTLDFYVIYGPNTTDYPGEFVTRIHRVKEGQVVPDPDLYSRAPTLGEARALIPEGLVGIARSAEDDPVIVESWL